MKVHIWDNGESYDDHAVLFVSQDDLSDDEMDRLFRAWNASEGIEGADGKARRLGIVESEQLTKDCHVQGIADFFQSLTDNWTDPEARSSRHDEALKILGHDLILKLLRVVEESTRGRGYHHAFPDRLKRRRLKLEASK